MRRKLHDLYPWIGSIVAVTTAHRFGRIELRAFHAASSSSLFSGLLTFSGLVVSVLLALLGILVGLEQRDVIKHIRERRLYGNLVHLAFTPMVVFMALSVFCVAGLFGTKDDNFWFRVVVSDGLIGLMALGLLATFRFARELVLVMVDDQSREDDGAIEVTPEDAARRGAGQRPKSSTEGAGNLRASAIAASP